MGSFLGKASWRLGSSHRHPHLPGRGLSHQDLLLPLTCALQWPCTPLSLSFPLWPGQHMTGPDVLPL